MRPPDHGTLVIAIIAGAILHPRTGLADSDVPVAADAPPRPSPPQERGSHPKRIGVGYKAGNGLGYLCADLNLALLRHVDVDLQAGWFPKKYGASGFGVAPTIRVTLNGDGQSTPYISAGIAYFSLEFDGGAHGHGDGGTASLGYEWKWASGLGVLLGAGVLYTRDLRLSDPGLMILGADGLHPNVEFGVRYRFL
jgi:hypothetical protein